MSALPYHSAVYHLDLCTLAYQLHSQSLRWPFDPYYEQLDELNAREKFIQSVRKSHGNGADATLDPIDYDYAAVHPQHPCFVMPEGDGPLILYRSPVVITSTIKTLHIIPFGEANRITRSINEEGQDIIYCFEGKTGCKVEKGRISRSGQTSLMGFVLKRMHSDNVNFDLHIVFRGSRSGEVRILQAKRGKGNPDWVTDLKTRIDIKLPEIFDYNRVGTPQNGIGSSIVLTMPNIMTCINEAIDGEVANLKKVTVAGHSLGGGLAAQFASALIMGKLSPTIGEARKVNWKELLEVFTYAAPPVGNESFAYIYDDWPIKTQRYFCAEDLVVQGYDLAGQKPTKFARIGTTFYSRTKINWHVGRGIRLRFLGGKKHDRALKLTGIGGLPHEPVWIRLGLLERINQNEEEGVKQAIPYNVNPNNVDNPWRIFKNLETLVTKHGLDENIFQNRLGQLDHNKNNVLLYLDHLIVCLRLQGQLKQVMTDVLTFKENLRVASDGPGIKRSFTVFSDTEAGKIDPLKGVLRTSVLMLLYSLPLSR